MARLLKSTEYAYDICKAGADRPPAQADSASDYVLHEDFWRTFTELYHLKPQGSNKMNSSEKWALSSLKVFILLIKQKSKTKVQILVGQQSMTVQQYKFAYLLRPKL